MASLRSYAGLNLLGRRQRSVCRRPERLINWLWCRPWRRRRPLRFRAIFVAVPLRQDSRCRPRGGGPSRLITRLQVILSSVGHGPIQPFDRRKRGRISESAAAYADRSRAAGRVRLRSKLYMSYEQQTVENAEDASNTENEALRRIVRALARSAAAREYRQTVGEEVRDGPHG
jgi:hypothetical protein